MSERLGIMGGTFDPIHYGHLFAAECARQAYRLDRVHFVTAARPPHKDEARLTPAAHRHAMVILATASNPFFHPSDVELVRPGPSYTVDTIAAFQMRHPEAELYFITGADALYDFLSWHDVEAILMASHVVAVARPGYPPERLNHVRYSLAPVVRPRIHYLEVPALNISSSEVRERVRAGLSIRYLVPDPVEQYIAKERLYLEKVEDRQTSGVDVPSAER